MGLAPYPWLERPAEVLAKMLNKLPGGILIYGPRGCGVFELASRFAAAVVCQHPVDGAPCGICEECKLIFSGNHPDLRYVLSETEAALHPEPWNGKFGEIPKGKSLSKQILIEQVRGIGEYLSVTAHRAGHRAVVIYPADSMSGDQSSALLKTLEEPPEGAVLILVGDDINSILPTIRSRCQLVRCTPPTREQGIAYLKSQKVRNPEGELTRLSGRPLLIHEADPNLTLDKKDEAKYLEMLALGSALSSVQVLSAFQKDIPVGPVVSIMQRWYWDLMAVLSGAEPRYFPEHFEAYKRQVQGTDFQKLVPFNQTLMQANRSKDHPLSKSLALQELLITSDKTLADARKHTDLSFLKPSRTSVWSGEMYLVVVFTDACPMAV